MVFKIKQIKGESRKKRKEYHCKPYVIVWRREAFGVEVTPGYQTFYRVGKITDFVERKLYKSLKVAVKACEKHYKAMTKLTTRELNKLEKQHGRVLWDRD